MNQKKYIVTILLVCMLAALLAGCKKKEKKPEIVKGTIPEMLEAMQAVKEGKLSIEYSYFQKRYDEKDISKTVGADIEFDRADNEYSITGIYNDSDSSTKDSAGFDRELVRITGNTLYFNLEALSGNSDLLGIDAEKLSTDGFSGWFALPLPDDFPKELSLGGIESAILTLVEKAVKGQPTEGLEGDYTVTVKTREDYAQLLKSLKDYSENDLQYAIDNVTGFGNTFANIDWNKYAEKLLDKYESDLREAVKALSEEPEADEVKLDEYLKEVKNQDFNKIVKQTLKNTELRAESTQETVTSMLDSLIVEIAKDSDATDKPTECSVHIKADDDAYSIVLQLNDTTGTEEIIKIAIRLAPGSRSVKAPGDTKSLKQIADMVSTQYLAYVNKSRMTADVSMFCQLMYAGERLAADVVYEFPKGTVLSIYIEDGACELNIISPDGSVEQYPAAVDDWKWLANYKESGMFSSSAMKSATVRAIGTVDRDGSVTWSCESYNDSFRKILDFSPELRKNWLKMD